MKEMRLIKDKAWEINIETFEYVFMKIKDLRQSLYKQEKETGSKDFSPQIFNTFLTFRIL